MPKFVFCFDRDATVSSGEPEGPVDLYRVRHLHFRTENDVWAIGNQKLKGEAEIPGIAEAKERVSPEALESVDLDEGTVHAGFPARKNRLRLVEALYSGEGVTFVHIDDCDVGAGSWYGWIYFTPGQFAASTIGADDEG